MTLAYFPYPDDAEPMIVSRYLGAQILDRLEELRMHQAQVARLLEVDPSIVQLWCADRRPVPDYRIPYLAMALRMTPAALLDQAEPIEPATPTPAVEAADELVVGPSDYPLLWCGSSHGTGEYRRHHHGPRPSWAPGTGNIEAA